MIDLETVDKMFDCARETGAPIRFGLFDRRVLLPLDQLLRAVNGDRAAQLTLEDLKGKADAGWFPLLPMNHDLHDVGAPLYVDERIRLLLELQSRGYTADELRTVVEYEEAMIDGLLTVGEFEYVDDDLDCLIVDTKARIEDCETGSTNRNGELVDKTQE